MSVMMILMMIVSGMATALAIYFLLAGLFSYEPHMDARMVEDIGVIPAVFIFALCGPVLVLKLWFTDDGTEQEQGDIFAFMTTGTIALFWSATIGVFATYSIQATIMPKLAPLLAQL